jgi:hypothetical protein
VTPHVAGDTSGATVLYGHDVDQFERLQGSL